MTWSPAFTMVLFYVLVFFMYSLGFLHFDIDDDTRDYALDNKLIKERDTYDTKLSIIFGIFFLNATGCIINKILQGRHVWVHGLIQTWVIYFIIHARKDEVEEAEKIKRIYLRNSWIIDFASLVYIVTYILSLHLVVFRYGLTEAEERLHCEIHAATGVVSLITSGICCIIYSYAQKIIIALPYKTTYLGQNYLIISVLFALLLVLEPNFSWRHMAIMFGKPIQNAVVSSKK